MGTIVSTPNGDFIGTKLSYDSQDEDHAVGVVRKVSPAMTVRRDVRISSEQDWTERTDRTVDNFTERSDRTAGCLFLADEKINVNIPMADLMAYLQVVANHSQNLPKSIRDDPDLDRMTSTLTASEYAKKSSAFIPSDVRVIGGSFLRYGRVWDLPSLAEYSAYDGAQEPGRSYGGANCNALLKALYDSAADVGTSGQGFDAGHTMFDDDDEESLASYGFRRNSTFGDYSIGGNLVPSSMSWLDLLRRMKTEIEDIEFAQAPTLSTSRKLDLSKPFSLVPANFDKKTGKKRSLLIGCNYKGLDHAQLKASHDDISSMKDYIVTVHGFSESKDSMTVLIDDGEHKPPTFKNIIEGFKRLSEESQPGDVVFVQFSGHGGRVLGSTPDEEADTYDEVLAPADYEQSGLIRDTLIFKTLIAPMRFGVTVTILIDTCDTGMMVDLPYVWSTRRDKPGKVAKMEENEDYSFVRFLKVIKTLYESSTFTQLGNLVGSAIGDTESVVEEESSDDDEVLLNINSFNSYELTKTEDKPYWQCTAPSFTRATNDDGIVAGDIPSSPIDESFMDRLVMCAMGNEFFNGGENTDVECDKEESERSRERSHHSHRRSREGSHHSHRRSREGSQRRKSESRSRKERRRKSSRKR